MSYTFTRGMIIPLDGGAGPVRFQWNPTRLRGPNASATWAAIAVAGREHPYLQYSSGQQSNIPLDLIYQTESDGGAEVLAAFLQLMALTTPIPRGVSYKRPPLVALRIGAWPTEICVVTEIRPDFVVGTGPEFADTLLPAEATISVNLWRWRG
jgi:hypothetical protein